MESPGEQNLVFDTLKRPLRDLRISVTDRCNFRCTYCMPAEIYGERYQFLPKKELLTFEEITRVAKIMVGMGVEKIRLTGGEPLVRSDLEKLITMLSNISGISDLTMTTNAYLLPQKAQALKDAGLNRITVSLDTLDDEIFRKMNGRSFGIDKVIEGIDAAREVGFDPIKVNSVVQRNVNEHTLIELADYCRKNNIILRFIEYMDVGNRNGWLMDQVVPSSEIISLLDSEFHLEPLEPNYTGEVARRFRYQDGSGEIGVISSVTAPFCGNCTRMRLSPEGTLYTCLFGSDGKDLRKPMREGLDDQAIKSLIERTWKSRKDRYSDERTSLTEFDRKTRRKVEMYHIGG